MVKAAGSNHVDIINLSIATLSDPPDRPDCVADAVHRAYEKGILIVFAAGNWGPREGTMSRFALFPGVISVGSADLDGTAVSEFSSRGWPNRPNSGPTIVAPGEDIPGLALTNKAKTDRQRKRDRQTITIARLQKLHGREYSTEAFLKYKQDYTVMSGTSAATACVSGLLARFIELRRLCGLPHDYAAAIEFLRRVARPIPGYGQHEQGFGFASDETISAYFTARFKYQDGCWLTNDSFWKPQT